MEFLEDPKDAIRREAREEVGIALNKVIPVDINVSKAFIDPNFQFISAIWFCSDFNYLNKKIVLSDEHSEYVWINFDEVKNFEVSNLIKIHYDIISDFLKNYNLQFLDFSN